MKRYMKRVICPSRDELSSLRTPLNKGEELVLDFFDRNLSLEWEIYIQPHLNGIRPDFVLLNRKVGIAVFEVKDWNLKAIDYKVKRPQVEDGHLGLYGNTKNTEFKVADPVEQIQYYKSTIRDLFCARMERNVGSKLITAGIIFTSATSEETNVLLKPLLEEAKMTEGNLSKFYPVSGIDDIQSNSVCEVFPYIILKSSDDMKDDFYYDFHTWLKEPSISAEQREPLKLNDQQEKFVNTRTNSGYRRLKGSAGSGKTVVLAAKAAKLFGEGKKVLVITFNITLLHYIQDLAVRWSAETKKVRKEATWWHYHYWLRDMFFQTGYIKEYKNIWKAYFNKDDSSFENLDKLLNDTLSDNLEEILDSACGDIGIIKYDAILVDEGQDFNLKWWNLLRKVLEPGGEMILAYDTSQDIYDKSKKWTDQSMIGAGFPGGAVTELKISYRLPVKYLPLVRDFALNFQKQSLQNLPELPDTKELNLFDCNFSWLNISELNAVDICTSEIVKMMQKDPSDSGKVLNVIDIIFLCSSNDLGLKITESLKIRNKYYFAHTFAKSKIESKRRKHAFFLGNPMLKATTIQSFKGYEAKAIVLYINKMQDEELTYVGLTRLKENSEGNFITVINANPKFDNFGNKWNRSFK